MKLTLATTLRAGLITALPLHLCAAEFQVPKDYPSIQEAVDASTDGDTIRVASGVYLEQVFVNESGDISRRNENLTIIGEPGTILRAFEGMRRLGNTANLDAPMVFVSNLNLHLRGITFEGERLAAVVAPDDFWLVGAMFSQAGGSIEDCHFHGFTSPRENLEETSQAIAFFNEHNNPPLIEVRITNNTFTDTDGAIWLDALRGSKSIIYTIEGNTIAGVGPLERPGAGIEIRGAEEGVIRNNIISGFSYIDAPPEEEFPFSSGLVIFDELGDEASVLPPIVVEGNHFRNNQSHFYIARADNLIVRNNVFEGDAPGHDPSALNLSGKDVIIEGNSFVGFEKAIVLWGEDPTYGTILGKAEDVQVINNRFIDVTDYLTIQPTASVALEEGTILSPTLQPDLTITRAIQLSWPGFDDRYRLESAPSADGPWSLVDANPMFVNGALTAWLPAGEGSQFFRLRLPE